MQKVKKSYRKLAQKLSCMDTPYEEPPLPAWSGGTSSASLRAPVGSSQPMTSAWSGATSAVRTPPHYSAGKDPATEDDEDDDDDDPPGLPQTARPVGRLAAGRDRHVSARWCSVWYPRSLTGTNKGCFFKYVGSMN